MSQVKSRQFAVERDCHVHTRLCHHAEGEMAEYVQAALQKGLKGLVFLEHFETGINYFEPTWLNDDDFALYFEQGLRLREEYRGRLEIGLGVEVGYNPGRINEIREFLSRYSWDLIGLSYHYYEHEGRHINMLSHKGQNMAEFSVIGVEKVIGDYLRGLLEGLRQLPVNVVCHLDAALRHHKEVNFKEEHIELIQLILSEIAARGLALEINTSGFVHRGEPYPKKWIIRQALKMGIRTTVGSDAHRPAEVGRYFERLNPWLLQFNNKRDAVTGV